MRVELFQARALTPWQPKACGAYCVMRFTRTALLAGTVAVGFLTAKAGQTAESLRERPSSEIREARFSRLRGMSVENLDGERLGAIKDFVIDMRTGEAKFGLVAPSGWR